MPESKLPPGDQFPWSLPPEPPVEQYPSYFAAETPKSSPWSRSRVGIVSGLAGLILGIGVGASGADSPDVPTAGGDSSTTEVKVAVAAALTEAEKRFAEEQDDATVAAAEELTRIEEELNSLRAEAKADLREAARTARARQRRAVATAVAAEKRRGDARVAAAQASQPRSLAGVSSGAGDGSGTDPRFNWCYEANDAGYGPYYQGRDTEYDWYDDADGDGIVCES